jgi:O-antigen/teichoic acid export membrane protein
MGIGTLGQYMWKRDRTFFKSISFSRVITNAKRYIQFPLFSFPASVINALSVELPVFMFSGIYGLTVVGMYSLSYSLIILSTSFIGSSLAQVYYAEVSNMIRENSREIKKIYISTTKRLFFLGIPLILIPCLLAPFFFPLIFGEQWADAGIYCLPLAILALANFVVSPISMLSLYGFNYWQLIWDISRLLLVFFGFYVIQVLLLPVIIALFIYSSVMALMYGVNFLMNLWAIDHYQQEQNLQNPNY